MNCEDILEILDDGDPGRLDARRHAEVSAHLSTCSACAGQWHAQAEFLELPYPEATPAFAAQCRTAVVSAGAGRRVRAPYRRHLVIGGAAVLAAAAATMSVLWPRPSPHQATDSRMERVAEPAASVAPQAVETGATPARNEAWHAATGPDSQPDPLAPPASAPTFIVRVTPLENLATDGLSRDAAETFHAALLAELRQIPGLGLRLLDQDDDGSHTDYVLRIRIDRPGPPGTLRTMMRIRKPGPTPVVVPIAGEFTLDCVPDATTGACGDAPTMAGSMTNTLRMLVFSSEILPQDLHARIADAGLSPRQRLQALQSLASPRVVHTDGRPVIDPGVEALRDPAVIRGAIDLARVANPGERAQLWRTLRGVRSAELIEPLIAAGHLDPDEQVRVQALTTLGADFAADGRVRAALETIAGNDGSPLVRALAQRWLTGDQPWLRYVSSTLKDDSRPLAQRLEPLFLHLNDTGGSAAASSAAAGDAMDDASLVALADALSRALDSPVRERALIVISHLDAIRHPAITDMLLEAVRRDGEWFQRRQLLNQLAHRLEDARVRSAMEAIAADDPDADARSAARAALSKASPAGNRESMEP